MRWLFSQAFEKHDFYRVLLFALTHQARIVAYEKLACKQAPGGASAEQTFGAKLQMFAQRLLLQEPVRRLTKNIIVELHSNVFYVLFLFEDFDLTATRSLAIDICICLNHQELSSFVACLSFCWLKEMKLKSVILSPGQTESQVEGIACRG